MKANGINTFKSLVMALIFGWLFSCTYYENEPIKIPQPKVPKETENLEATYVADVIPNSINSPYWQTSDFKTITLSNVTIGQVTDEVGLLNVNGTYNGLDDFSEGTDLAVELKAAYNDGFLYLLASWKDKSFDLSQHSWLYDGPEDPLKPELSNGWTSQRNDDNIIFEFDMGGGKSDVWKWSLALSEPLGFALDMMNDGSTTTTDSGDKMYVRNINGTGNNAGPMYEWSGEQQELDREYGGFTLLDPGFYLINKTAFTGNIVNGAMLYQAECAECHGVEGDGKGFNWDTGYAMNIPGFLNRLSRESFATAALSSTHDGASHFEKLTTEERDDLVAMVRGFTGVPGYYLENPSGSNSDVKALSNVQLAKVNTRTDNKGYSVLFIRKLDTGNNDDIQFVNPESMNLNFNVYLTNNDDLNKVGAIDETITFKQQ
jgi:mono/diheme cytochrome c family protein